MNIKKYIAFLHTVESGNITQSARELGYTQSAVSKMIADLESEWNTKLLVRSNDGVQLTSDGIALLPLIQAVVRDYRNLNFMVSEMHHMEAGLLRLGCFTSFSVGLLPKILKDFREHYPHIAIQLFHGEYGDLTEYLQRGVVDCAFLAMPAAPGLEVKFLLQDSLVAMLPEGHYLAAAPTYQVRNLPGESFIRLKETQDYEINRFLDSLEYQPKSAYEVQSDFALLSMVESGLGISIVHDLMLRPMRYRLRRLPLDVTAFRDIGIAWKSGPEPSSLTKLFVEHVLSYKELGTFFDGL